MIVNFFKSTILGLACLLSTYTFGQYSLTNFKNQNYSELTNPIYTINDGEPAWNNAVITPALNFKCFSQSYKFNEGVYLVIQQGYVFFTNNTHSLTFYVAEGVYKGREGFNQQSSFSFQVDTIFGESVLKLQWKNMGFQYGDSTHYSNFQLFLYANSGKLRVNFGSSNTKPGLFVSNLNGPSIGFLEMDQAFSMIHKVLYLEGDAEDPSFNKSGDILNLNNVPVNGTSYEFIPSNTKIISNLNNYELPVPYFSQNNLAFRDDLRNHFDGDFNIEIKNSIGQNLYNIDITLNANTEIAIPPGVYFITVRKDNVFKVFKVLKL